MAWKNFQNGYPLYASELNNYLMNQAVVVFASAAERDSVLTSPVEGQVVWLQDTNAFKIYNGTAWTDINDNTDAIQKSLLTTAGDTIYATGSATPARLALGSTGSLLKSNGTAPAWLGVGTSGQVLSSTGSDLAWTTISAGGMALISTTNLSGVGTTISSIPSGYKNLVLSIEGVYGSASSIMYVMPNASYVSHFHAKATNIVNQSSSIIGSTVIENNSTEANKTSIYYRINNYTSTTQAKTISYVVSNYGFSYNAMGWAGVPGAPSAITSIRIETNGTATFSGGVAKLYGEN